MIDQRGIRYFIYALFIYGWLSANIPMPILPSLVHIYGTTEAYIKLSVTAFLLGFALTQIIWGPLSDKYGRRCILVFGFIITVLGAWMTTFSVNIGMFISARFIEAVGIGCGPAVGRSMITDTFAGKAVTHAVAMSAVIVGVMPAVAPIMGSWLNAIFGWRSVFYFLVLYGLALLFFSATQLQETHVNINRSLTFHESMRSYLLCFKHRQYVGSLLLYGLFYGLQLGYYTAAPFIFVVHLHYAPENYAWLMVCTVVAYIGGAYVSKHLIKIMSLRSIIVMSLVINLFGVLLLIALASLSSMNAVIVIIPMVIVIMSSGMMSPAVNTISMLAFSENRGASSALLGCSMAGFSAIFSAVMALFSNQNLLPLVGMLSFVIIAGVIVYTVTLWYGQRNLRAE